MEPIKKLKENGVLNIKNVIGLELIERAKTAIEKFLSQKSNLDVLTTSQDTIRKVCYAFEKDEVFLDSKSITTSMDCIYEHTSIDPHFQELYVKSAGRMFSTDPQIGQAVLCAYDTFMLYYSAVWHFLHGGVSALLNCPEYKKLVSYFDKRL